MIAVTPAVVLWRRPAGEYDRQAALYTREFGRLAARFVGVDRPGGKLKALAEPMVHADFRLHIRPGTGRATVTGGALIDSHPGLRAGLFPTLWGLEMCELLLRLTPEAAPNPRKYELIVRGLGALEGSASAWLPLAFGLRLLKLAGFGLEDAPTQGEDAGLWGRLHRQEFRELAGLPDDPRRLARFRGRLERAAESLLESPLRSRLFREVSALRPARDCSAPPTENSPPRRWGEFPPPSPGGRAPVPSEGDLSGRPALA